MLSFSSKRLLISLSISSSSAAILFESFFYFLYTFIKSLLTKKKIFLLRPNVSLAQRLQHLLKQIVILIQIQQNR
jgi:hypothetical protein